MSTLLHINSSARGAGSISRQLSTEFVQLWKQENLGGAVVDRDLSTAPVPHLDEALLGAFFTPVEQRTPAQAQIVKLSDQLIDELLAADVVVIAAPMYNFSVPSTLKTWIDHVLRAGRTFKYTDSGPVGLVPGDKRVVVFTARGGVYSQGSGRSMDFHETYLRGVLGFIGLTKVEFVHTEGLALGPETAAKAVEATRTAIPGLVA